MNTAHLNVFSQSQAPAGATPFAYYKFENNGNDSVGTNNAATIGAPTYLTTGVFAGVSTRFDSPTEYFEIPDANEFSFTDGVSDKPFSIAFSFTPEVNKAHSFVFKRDRTVLGGSEWQIIYSGGKTYLYLFNFDASGYIFAYETLNILIGSYYNFIFTYDGSELNTGIKVYINDVSANTYGSVGAYVGMTNADSKVRIGQTGYNTGANNAFGVFDNLAFYDFELTPAEVTDINTKMTNGIELI